LECKMCSCL